MTNLIPINSVVAEQLNSKFSGTMFQSTDQFIDFYNSGYINKRAEDIAGFAQEVDAAFKNVKLESNNLVFISETEVYLEELAEEIRVWEVVAKVRRLAQDLVMDGSYSEEDEVFFSASAPGLLLRKVNDFNDDYEPVAEEKLYRRNDEDILRTLHSRYSSLAANEDRVAFRLKDFIEVSDAFVKDIYEITFSD